MNTIGLIGLVSSICSIVGLIIVLWDKITAMFQNRIVWNLVLKSAKKIVNKMEEEHYTPELIIAGGRGGLILAPLISWNLGPGVIQIANVDYYFMWEDKQRKIIFNNGPLSIKNKNVLICVGQVNSGDTLRTLIAEIKTYGPKEIKTACVFNNNARLIAVDYVGEYQKQNKKLPWHFQNFNSNKKTK